MMNEWNLKASVDSGLNGLTNEELIELADIYLLSPDRNLHGGSMVLCEIKMRLCAPSSQRLHTVIDEACKKLGM